MHCSDGSRADNAEPQCSTFQAAWLSVIAVTTKLVEHDFVEKRVIRRGCFGAPFANPPGVDRPQGRSLPGKGSQADNAGRQIRLNLSRLERLTKKCHDTGQRLIRISHELLVVHERELRRMLARKRFAQPQKGLPELRGRG